MTTFQVLTDTAAAAARSLVLDVRGDPDADPFASALFGPEAEARNGAPHRLYRYALLRRWDRGTPPLAWMMLNPSTADAFNEDATVTRVLARSRAAGAGGAIVVNLFGYRATDPADMKSRYQFAVGGHNDPVIEYVLAQPIAGIVAAWGGHGDFRGRAGQVLPRLLASGHPVWRLDKPLTASGQPRHPLMVGNAVPLVRWDGQR